MLRPVEHDAISTEEHCCLVTCDIANDKRWRGVFRLLHGYGEWLQLSVFQCRLTRRRFAEMRAALGSAISATEDHVLVFDLGIAEQVETKVHSLGKKTFHGIERVPVIV